MDLLSICIPTFNRSKALDLLFKDLYEISLLNLKGVNFYISNNASTDDTAAIIEKWKKRFNFNCFSQDTNIGATRNFFSVIKKANSDWVWSIGDDDRISLSEFKKIYYDLKKERNKDIWFICGVQSRHNKKLYVNDSQNKNIDSQEIYNFLYTNSIDTVGFTGSNIIPRVSRNLLDTIQEEFTKPWPHIVLLLIHANQNRDFAIRSIYPAIQTGYFLSWRCEDWIMARLRQFQLLQEPNLNFKYIKQSKKLYLKHLYSIDFLKEIALWKRYDNISFNKISFKIFKSTINSNLSNPKYYGIFFLILILKLQPSIIFNVLLDLLTTTETKERFSYSNSDNDAILRGS